jgi:Zinc dependent phospholipase C
VKRSDYCSFPVNRKLFAGFYIAILLGFPRQVCGYSVLTHEAIMDTLWADTIQPVLLMRFPTANEEQLREAHAYAYGGCLIQDLGYYPFGSHFFSDLTHYVRSADFLTALLDESRDLNEYAFALGAVAHYGADVDGHSIAVNRAVPLLYPKLRSKFGNEVTYADNPQAHLKTEFGFDVLQVARGHYAPAAYHNFIGFQVSKDLLERAFQKTYGLTLKDIFRTLDLALGTYRFSVSAVLPKVTKTAWAIKNKEIMNEQPSMSRKLFIYNVNRASFEKEWGKDYQRPGFGTQLLALGFRLMPKFGSFKGLTFRVPTPEIERMFEDSFDAAIARDRRSFAQAEAGGLRISNRDLDTGRPVSSGEYLLTDRTYDKLLTQLAEKSFEGVTPELRENILNFYAQMKTPDQHGIGPQLTALKNFAKPEN